MAQRTGAERFLAPLAKSASARVALALALAALFLCGCGGGSSDSKSTASTASADATSGSTAAAGADQGETPAAQGAQEKAAAESQTASAAAGVPGASAASGKGAKHGKHIVQPKGAPEQAPTPAQSAAATVADMTLESPAIAASGGAPGPIPPTYTCDGEGSWPALHWSGVPVGTKELALFVMNVQPVQEKLFVDWAVAGLDPSLEGLEAARLPRGAVVGTNGFGKAGYEICPPPGSGETYMFAVYALPQRLSPPKGFDGRELRGQILEVSGNVGLMAAAYARH